MRIRAATVEDARAIAELNVVVQELHWRARPDRFKPPDAVAFEPTLRDWLAQETTFGFLAEEADRPVGYVLAVVHRRRETALARAYDFLELDQIAVLPDARQSGIGAALVSRVFQLAAEIGMASVQLAVWDLNDRARRFFAAQGFTPIVHRMAADVRPG